MAGAWSNFRWHKRSLVYGTFFCDCTGQSTNAHTDTYITSAHCDIVTFYANSNIYTATIHCNECTAVTNTYRSNTDKCSSNGNANSYSRCRGYSVHPTGRI